MMGLMKPGQSFDEYLAEAQREVQAAREQAPCRMSREHVQRCTDDYADTCVLHGVRSGRDHCPRAVVEDEMRLTERERIAKRAMLAAHGVPERVLRVAFDRQPANTPSVAAVRRFMASDKNIMLMVGTSACGKTVAAGWACTQPDGTDWPLGRYARLVDLVQGAGTKTRITACRGAELLVLDGIASIPQTPAVSALVDDIVDAVYSAHGRVILVSDVRVHHDPERPDVASLDRWIGRRTWSRIKDAGVVESQLGGRYTLPVLPQEPRRP